jgi:hypothetical protein
MHATQRPNGSYEFGTALYRLVERGDELFDIVREEDGSVAGCLRMNAHQGGGPEVEALPGSSSPEVVEAICKILGAPRGALPLQ